MSVSGINYRIPLRCKGYVLYNKLIADNIKLWCIEHNKYSTYYRYVGEKEIKSNYIK